MSYVIFYSLCAGNGMITYGFPTKEYGNHLGLHVFKKYGYAYVVTSLFVYIFDYLVISIGMDYIFTVIIIMACLCLIMLKFSV